MTLVAVRSAKATAAEEASGAGLVNFGLLVTASVLDPGPSTGPDGDLDVTDAPRAWCLRGGASHQSSLQIDEQANGERAAVLHPGEGVLGGA